MKEKAQGGIINATKRSKEINQIIEPLDPLASLGNRKLMPLSKVKIESVQWLVPDLIPLGSITIMDGEKAQGKSTLCYVFAAHVTSGTPIPLCNSDPITGGVILLQAEDDLGATVRRSIEAAGGDPKKVRVFTKRATLYLDNPEDLHLVRQAAKEVNAKLPVADPFSEFFQKNLKDEKTIRESFRLLRAVAYELKMAVILVRHFTKCGASPLYRGLGGVAVINAARAALVVGHDPSSDNPFQHVLAFNKGNLPRTRDVSLTYRTVKRDDAIVIEWMGESKYSAEDLVAATHNPDAHSQLQEACYVLYSILFIHGGPLPATEVYKAAQDALVSIGTLKRAKKLLKVRSRRKTFDILVPVENDRKEMEMQTVIRWVWELPNDEELLQPYKERQLREKKEDESNQPATSPIANAINPISLRPRQGADQLKVIRFNGV